MGKDYYAILGIPRSADDAQIKAAYKKAALKYHPDRNVGNSEAANTKFKEVSEAFQVLSDKNQRAVYDQFGEDGLKGGAPPPGAGGMGSGFPGGSFQFTNGSGQSQFTAMDPNEIFSQIFGNQFSFGSTGGGGGGGRRAQSHDMFGSGMNIDEMMGGMGGMPGGFSFGGAGAGAPKASHSHPSHDDEKPLDDIIKPLELSLEDLYKGTVKRLRLTRKMRDGSSTEKTVEVNVKPGWKAGTKIRFPGSGNEDRSGRSAAVVFEVAQKPHPRFTREGDDLVYVHAIPLVEALTGPEPYHNVTRTLKHLDGRNIEFKLPLISPNGAKPIEPGQEIILPGEGMPITRKGAPRTKGDLKVRIKVNFPTWLDANRIQATRKLFASGT